MATGTLIDTAVATSHELPNTISSNQSNAGQTKPVQSKDEVQAPLSSSKMRSKKFRHTFAIHSTRKASCLSHDSEAAPSFLGFKNLMVLMLIVSNLRLMIENFKKYGVLICLSCHDYRRQDVIYGSILYLLVPCHLFVAYIIELAAAQQAKGAVARAKKTEDTPQQAERERKRFQTTWHLIALAHGINATLNLIIATTVVYYYIHHPGIGTLCEIHAVIVWLKTSSYALTNRDLRHSLMAPSDTSPMPEIYTSCPYPQNITLRNLTYFWWAPTLVYQPVYPRTDKIRWPFVFKRLAEVVGLSIVIWIASAQYAAPLLQNSLDKISTLDLTAILERILKLSTISLFCWLAGFFALFHSFLNALAEVTRFGDREFYTDWWNSYSVRSYWTTWNKPVFHFMKRHIYSPLVGRGVPPQVAQILVFVFSGVLHELLVGVPTHNILGVAFLGMLLQLPLIILTDPLPRYRDAAGHVPVNAKVVGNLVFWVSFCLVGQPLAALLYFFVWQAKYGSVSRNVLWSS
ncbi:diacylglycerol acyltransferase DGAT2 [Cryomyces antarcticus]